MVQVKRLGTYSPTAFPSTGIVEVVVRLHISVSSNRVWMHLPCKVGTDEEIAWPLLASHSLSVIPSSTQGVKVVAVSSLLWWVVSDEEDWGILLLASHFLVCLPLRHWECRGGSNMLPRYCILMDYHRRRKWVIPAIASHYFIFCPLWYLENRGSSDTLPHWNGWTVTDEKDRANRWEEFICFLYIHSFMADKYGGSSNVLHLQSHMNGLYWFGRLGNTATCVPLPHLLQPEGDNVDIVAGTMYNVSW